MSTVIKNTRKIFVNNSGGGGSDPSLGARVTVLEDNEYKITYFEAVSSASGTVTIPTGATILLDQFQGGIDAYVSTIVNGQPTGILPTTSGGTPVDVSYFDSLGNYTLTGTPSSFDVALIYRLSIKAVDYSNLIIDNILDLESNFRSDILDISSIRYTGKYYTVPYSGNLNTVLAGYVGAVYMFPVPIGEDHSIDALRFKVTSAVALSTITIGLWGDDGSGLPGNLLLNSGTIPTDTTGDKTYTFTQIDLTGKIFFYGIICSDNISLLGTNNPLPLLERASGSDSAPSAVACNTPFASNPSLYPVTHYNTPIIEFRKV